MLLSFIASCFAVGLFSTLGLGPIFILTFNRSALHGFLRGFMTALGASIADGVLFGLGLAGFLSLIGETTSLRLFLDLVGGFLLISMGIYFYRRIISLNNMEIKPKESLIMIFCSAFVLTLIHPGSLLFFGYMSMQVSEGIDYISMSAYALGILAMVLGSLASLSIVSVISSRIGTTVNKKMMTYISKGAGVCLVFIGIYFLYDFVRDGGLVFFGF